MFWLFVDGDLFDKTASMFIEMKQLSYSAMLNIPELVPPSKSIPSILESGRTWILSHSRIYSKNSRNSTEFRLILELRLLLLFYYLLSIWWWTDSGITRKRNRSKFRGYLEIPGMTRNRQVVDPGIPGIVFVVISAIPELYSKW